MGRSWRAGAQRKGGPHFGFLWGKNIHRRTRSEGEWRTVAPGSLKRGARQSFGRGEKDGRQIYGLVIGRRAGEFPPTSNKVMIGAVAAKRTRKAYETGGECISQKHETQKRVEKKPGFLVRHVQAAAIGEGGVGRRARWGVVTSTEIQKKGELPREKEVNGQKGGQVSIELGQKNWGPQP